MNLTKFWGNPLAVFSLPVAALALALSHCSAAPPDSEPREHRLQELQVVKGKVTELTKNKPGDVDGWKLKGGEVVHFPPHVGRELGDSIEIGTKVRVLASSKARPDGQVVMEALVIESDGRAFYITPPAPKPNSSPNAGSTTPPQRPDLPKEPGINATGVVASFQANKGGEVDGFALAGDESVIKFPPHLGKEVQMTIAKVLRHAAKRLGI